MASLAVWFNGCSRYRTRQHGSSLELVDVTTSLQYWESFIGCLWSRKSTSNWRWWCTSLCTASLRHTCRTTANSSLRWDVGTSCHPHSDLYTCFVPRTQSQIGDMSFMPAGPRLRNNLSAERRQRNITFEHFIFKRLMKMLVFGGDCGALWLSAKPAYCTDTLIRAPSF